MADRLVEIEPKNWSNLKNIYTPAGSKSYIAYTAIDNYIRWHEDPNLKHVKFYCLNGDYSDGTFVVTDRCSAYADTFNESFENLSKLLQLLDYSKGYMFLSERPELRPVILDAIQKMNVEFLGEDITLLYYLPKEEALKFDVQSPEGITLRPITETNDLMKANSVWPHRNDNSLAYFERAAKYNPNIGAYKDDGTLVAWIFRFLSGLLGALQTDEKHYGHGYGSLVAKSISKKIAEMGLNIYAGIFERNTPSRALFEKLGYKNVGQVHWISTKITWTPADE